MRISGKLLATLSLIVGLNTVIAPFEAHAANYEGDTIRYYLKLINIDSLRGTLNSYELPQLTVKTGPGLDATDNIISATISGGYCAIEVQVSNAFPEGGCNVLLTLTTDAANDSSSEKPDHGETEITVAYSVRDSLRLYSAQVTATIKVWDRPLAEPRRPLAVPEPSSLAFLGVQGFTCLGLCLALVAVKRRRS